MIREDEERRAIPSWNLAWYNSLTTWYKKGG